jgi:hypothetical protein
MNKSKSSLKSVSKRSPVADLKKCKFFSHVKEREYAYTFSVYFLVEKLARTLPVFWLLSTKPNVNSSVSFTKRRSSSPWTFVSRRPVLCAEPWLLLKSPRRLFVNKRRKPTFLFANMLSRLKMEKWFLLMHYKIKIMTDCSFIIYKGCVFILKRIETKKINETKSQFV